ncbi:MAG: VacJ family lipoprotein [Deltaproteobacteria bacterium]|nr:VacJ family lipoprotein [Deltaproteobacteria bacterium]
MLRWSGFTLLVLTAAITGVAHAISGQADQKAQLNPAGQAPVSAPGFQIGAQSPPLPPAGDNFQMRRTAPEPPTKSASSPAPLATVPSNSQDSSDPLEPVNRKVLNVNEKLDRTAVHPVANKWAIVVPKPARDCLTRFFDNTKFIPRFTNAVFQLKLRNAGGELARFGINSTIGVAGLFDPAGKWFGIEEHDNDFGTTLKTWGMSDGWFVMMPVGGPVIVRDTLGHFVDGAMNPMNYLVPASGEIYESVAHGIEGLNKRANDPNKFEGVVLEPDQSGPNSAGLYETVRANYLQRESRKSAEHSATPRTAAAIAPTAPRINGRGKEPEGAATAEPRTHPSTTE